jgi:hypothetical protein
MIRELDERHKEMRSRQARFCRIAFLQKNDAGHLTHCRETEDWDVCRIGPVSTYSGYGEHVFTNTETYQRDALLSRLEQAFERGRSDKARDIRKVLELV